MSQQTKNKNKTMISHPTHIIVPQPHLYLVLKKCFWKTKKNNTKEPDQNRGTNKNIPGQPVANFWNQNKPEQARS